MEQNGNGKGSLMEVTRQMLRDRPEGLTLPKIASDTGINFYWLRKFSGGEVVDPSVNTVQTLYEYLSGKPLLEKV